MFSLYAGESTHIANHFKVVSITDDKIHHLHTVGSVQTGCMTVYMSIVIGIDHDMVCAGVVCAATPTQLEWSWPLRKHLQWNLAEEITNI